MDEVSIVKVQLTMALASLGVFLPHTPIGLVPRADGLFCMLQASVAHCSDLQQEPAGSTA
jgi:hypothetical protein